MNARGSSLRALTLLVGIGAVAGLAAFSLSPSPEKEEQRRASTLATLMSPTLGTPAAPPQALYATSNFSSVTQRQSFPARTDRFLIKQQPVVASAQRVAPPRAIQDEAKLSGPELVAALLPPSPLPVESKPPVVATPAPAPAPAPAQDEYDAEIRLQEQRIPLDRNRARKPPQRASKGSLRILQIGDSHTAADYFTGEVRRLLQARFGDGGVGYMEAGRPHAGVRHSAIGIEASSGWTYTALQKTSDKDGFYLSGYNAQAARAGETLTFRSEKGVQWDVMEIEVLVGPNHGAIEVRTDGVPVATHQLKSDRKERMVLRTSANGRPINLHQLTIKTLNDSPVSIASVALFNSQTGLSFSKVGYPGATVDILNKLDDRVFTDELRRINPHMVVLAFGTNEGFNDNLNLVTYANNYLNVVQKIRQTLPDAKVVVVAPPAASRGGPCNSPPNLERVRARLIELAQDEKLQVWDWSSIMPSSCGAQAWASANPKLMASDHVHLTRAGYELSAKHFAKFLEPIVTEMRKIQYALSDY